VEPIFFESPEGFREWLSEHHATESEVFVGFHRRSSGTPSMTWAQAVDEALCFGWIDGIRRGIDASRYCNRFTPRRRGSTWSKVNVENVHRLTEQGRMQAAGVRAFEARNEARTGIYGYETDEASFDEASERLFRSNEAAWTWFQSTAPYYRRTATHWVMSAKRPETRERRLATLIADSERGERVGPLRPR